MASSIVLISENDSILKSIQKKLTLLREQDTIFCFPPSIGLDKCRANLPKVIIIPDDKEKNNALEILKEYKADKNLSSVPMLVYATEKNREFFTSAYELGADEILFEDTPDYEFLIRLIWLIQKGENKKIKARFDAFIEPFEIINKETGLIDERHSEEFLIKEIEEIKKTSSDASLMLLSPKDENKDFSLLIKNSIRNFDILAKIENKYFILLPETNQRSVKKLFARLSSEFRLEGGVCGVVGNVLKFEYLDIKQKMFETLEKIEENILVTLSKNNLEPTALTSKEIDEKQNKFKKIKNSKKSQEEDGATLEPIGISEESENAIEQDIQEINNEVKKIKTKRPKRTTEELIRNLEEKIENSIKSNEPISEGEIIRRNTRLHKLKEIARAKKEDTLFEQTFSKKSNLIIAPQFVKYKTWAEKNIKKIIADIIIEPSRATFMLAKGEITMTLTMNLEGSTVMVDIRENILEKTVKTKKSKVEILELDSTKMNKLMAIFMREVEKSIKYV